MLGHPARADYRALPRVVFTDPQVSAVGKTEGGKTATTPTASVARTSTYTRAYAERPGFLTLVSDDENLMTRPASASARKRASEALSR